jgi:O-acetyl-ADP-ribose deacetylase (regulator of RNase III)
MNSQNLEKASFLYKSTKFSVIHGNIVLERSNIIVNAANEDLWLGAGVAGAIDTAAGRSFL